VSVAQSEFIAELTHKIPELRPLLDSHMADNGGELLHHAFLGEVALWLAGLYSRAGHSHEALLLANRVVTFLEEAFIRGDESVRELIAVSFVENLPSTGELGASMRKLLGPALEEVFRRVNW